MAQQNTFSVVITSYGVGNLVERAVESVKNQTLDAVETVVVDDASQDEETLRSLLALEGKVRIERLEGRQGVGTARNRGMELTEAPYVLCLDGDDWIEPGYLEKAASIFENQPEIGIVSSWVRFAGERRGEWKPVNFDLDEILASNRIHSGSTFRRSASEAVGHYEAGFGGYEDWEHWISMTAGGWGAHVISEILLHYEIRPSGLGRRSDSSARELVESIVAKHQDLYRERMGRILAIKHEMVIALEAETRRAWARGEAVEEDLQQAWSIARELGDKLEKQGCGIGDLERKLGEYQDYFRHLEGDAAAASSGDNT